MPMQGAKCAVNLTIMSPMMAESNIWKGAPIFWSGGLRPALRFAREITRQVPCGDGLRSSAGGRHRILRRAPGVVGSEQTFRNTAADG